MQSEPLLDWPLGRIFGLLTPCLTTLIGVAVGLSPEMILYRALWSAAIGGAVGFACGRLLAALSQPN